MSSRLVVPGARWTAAAFSAALWAAALWAAALWAAALCAFACLAPVGSACAQTGADGAPPPAESGRALGSPARAVAPEPSAPAGYDVSGAIRVVVASEGSAQLSLFEDRGPGLEEAARFAWLCTAPCELHIAPGLYDLAVAREGGRPHQADHGRHELSTTSLVRLRYASRSAWRVGGWIMLLAGLPTGTGMWLAGYFAIGLGMLIPGGILGLFSIIVWLGAAFLDDSVDVDAAPLTVHF